MQAQPCSQPPSLVATILLVAERLSIPLLGNASHVAGTLLNLSFKFFEQLPIERVTPGSVFDKVGVDYAGPVTI